MGLAFKFTFSKATARESKSLFRALPTNMTTAALFVLTNADVVLLTGVGHKSDASFIVELFYSLGKFGSVLIIIFLREGAMTTLL